MFHPGAYSEGDGVSETVVEFFVAIGAVGPALEGDDKVVLYGGPTELTAVGPGENKLSAEDRIK